MFGLMVPNQSDLWYRSRYSRCCQIQRRFFGLVSLPVLNHDAVFLYSCGLDAGVVPPFAMPVQRCCRFGRLPPKSQLPDLAQGRFAGAVSVLFAEAKLRDDLRDGSAARARFGLSALRQPIARARSYFDSLDPEFLSFLGRLTSQQVALETGSPTLEQFVSPTAQAVSALARLLPGSQHRPSTREAMAQIGYHLGSAIVAADCAADWASDLAQEQINPIKTEVSATAAAGVAIDHINHIASIAVDAFGPDAPSARLAADVAARLRKRFYNPSTALDSPTLPLTNSHTKPLGWCVRFADEVGRATTCQVRNLKAEREIVPEGACTRCSSVTRMSSVRC